MSPEHQSSRRRAAPASTVPTISPQRPKDPARHAAYTHLAAIASRLPNLDPHPLDDKGLSSRDAAFAHAIVHDGLQRWLTLTHFLQQFLTKPFAELEPAVRGVLVGGSAQILLLDKVPVHAAINESVEWAKSTIRPGAGGMVNAVLRRVASLLHADDTDLPAWSDRRDELLLPDGSARKLSTMTLPDDELSRLAVVTSQVPTMIQAWRSRFGAADGRRLLLHSLVNPPTVVYTGAWPSQSPLPADLAPHDSADHHLFTGSRDDLQQLLKDHPRLWVQDAGSSEAVRAAAHLRPTLIIDLCAGQGTKTRQLASTFPNARIIASDTSKERFRTLQQIFAGSEQVQVIAPADLPSRFAKAADLILLDVPCSNTGVLARRIEAKYRWATNQLDRLVELQRTIIQTAMTLLSPQGRLLYSTCSLEPEENDQQAAWAVSRFGLVVEKTALSLPAGIPGDPPTRYRDGSFFALLNRPA